MSLIAPDGSVTRSVTTGGKTQGIAIHPDGRLFITDWRQRKIYVASPDGELSVYCDQYGDGTGLRGPNEISFSPKGQLYFTDPGDAWRGIRTGALSRVTSTGVAEILADGFEFTNGLDFDPKGEMIYFADTTSPGIFRAPLDSTGCCSPPPPSLSLSPPHNAPMGFVSPRMAICTSPSSVPGKVVVVGISNSASEDYLTLPGLFPTNLVFHKGSTFVCEGQTGSVWKFDDGIEGRPTYAEKVWNSEGPIIPVERRRLDPWRLLICEGRCGCPCHLIPPRRRALHGRGQQQKVVSIVERKAKVAV